MRFAWGPLFERIARGFSFSLGARDLRGVVFAIVVLVGGYGGDLLYLVVEEIKYLPQN